MRFDEMVHRMALTMLALQDWKVTCDSDSRCPELALRWTADTNYWSTRV